MATVLRQAICLVLVIALIEPAPSHSDPDSENKVGTNPATNPHRAWGFPSERYCMADVSAIVVYDAQMLIVTSKNGVAAIHFGQESKGIDPLLNNGNGVQYRFRFLGKGQEKEQTGEGKVFEKYIMKPTRLHGQLINLHIDQGAQLFLEAGPILLEWSAMGVGRGAVYYQPEDMRVQIAHPGLFSELDLKRFMK